MYGDSKKIHLAYAMGQREMLNVRILILKQTHGGRVMLGKFLLAVRCCAALERIVYDDGDDD